ncbi:hypothetical protein [Bradyrhizobium sp. 40]|uniref:hypothetical protein n=1 Tax=Bradyrhizobium sp. 40 TaxID=2782674 RepID=UPI001FFE2F65|nr:hypothetical protein [Bradyrhizobium sp. 40]
MSGSWTEAMRAGEFERAWAINDRDLATFAYPPKHTGPRHLQRIWRGEELRGKDVLVRCYHGLGDTIQFLRFMRPLRDVARRVTVWCQGELLPLVERAAGVDRAFALHDGAPEIDFEVDIEIMEVPHAIRARREHVEMRASYVSLPRAVEQVRGLEVGALAVGLVWEVGNWDKRRTIPPSLLGQLAVPGVTLCSLQRGAGTCELAEIDAKDVSTPDITVLGRLLQRLDLLICVDTMVAHLAGALGCDAWVLLHADCDWRWPSSESRSLWYPSLRLFHQRTSGNWDDVLGEAREALIARSASFQRVVRKGLKRAQGPP